MVNTIDEMADIGINETLVNFQRINRKRLVIVSLPGGMYEVKRMAAEKMLTKAGIPVYHSFDRAARALAKVINYWKFREKKETL